MRQATDGDLDTILTILEERLSWLHQRGSDQWSYGRSIRDKLAKRIRRGETWLLTSGDQVVGTTTIRTRTRSDFWTPAERAEPALYGSKMLTMPGHSGKQLGLLMYEWTRDMAAQRGLKYKRWTAWRTNEQLRKYWEGLGGELIRVVECPGRGSGALFQAPGCRIEGLSARVTTVYDESRAHAREDLAAGLQTAVLGR
jgi:GNAT superfamily N-acetyltransferase